MNDPIEEIFNGTPDGIDDDELKKMQAAQEMRAAELQPVEEEEESQDPSSSNQSTEKPKEESKPKADSGAMPVDDILAGKGPVMPGEAALTGATDWVVDAVNLTGLDAPKLPKYQDEIATAIRDISSVVTHSIFLTMTGVGALSQAGKASKLKVLSDPFVKWLGTTGASAGIGAGVDYVAETNQKDDNVLGVLKKSFPTTLGWVPDDLATLDSDSPDQKRAKNIYEGIGLGIFTDLIGGAVQFASALKKSDDATRWIPESEKAKNWLKKNASDPAEDVVEKSAAKRSKDLDDLGKYNFSKSQNLDEPVFGMHDLYGYEESGIRSADDMGIVGASIDQARIAKNIDSTHGRLEV